MSSFVSVNDVRRVHYFGDNIVRQAARVVHDSAALTASVQHGVLHSLGLVNMW